MLIEGVEEIEEEYTKTTSKARNSELVVEEVDKV